MNDNMVGTIASSINQFADETAVTLSSVKRIAQQVDSTVQQAKQQSIAVELAVILAISDPDQWTLEYSQRLESLGGWIHQVRDYLQAPGEASTVESMAALLLAEPCPMDALTVQSAVTKLLAPELIADMTMADAAAPQEPFDSDFSLATTDVDAAQLAAFLADAPLQNAQLEMAMLNAASSKLPNADLVRDVMNALFCLQQMVGYLQGTDDAPTETEAIALRLLSWIHWLEAQSEAFGVTPVPEFKAVPVAANSPSLVLLSQPALVNQGLQIGSDHLDKLIRRSGQVLMHNERAAQHSGDTEVWLKEVDRTNQLLIQGCLELELLAGRQQLASANNIEGSEDFDPLELERFNAIQTMARALDEKARDNTLLMDRIRSIAKQTANPLREDRYELVSQRQDLMALRTAEVRTIASRLKRNVHQTGLSAARSVSLEITGEDVRMDQEVLRRLAEPLLHLLRNAVDQGIEPANERRVADKADIGSIRVDFARDGQNISIRIIDDGRGLDLKAISRKAISLGLLAADATPSEAQLHRLILQHGFSTRDTITETPGRDMGLDIVNDRILQLGGQINIESVSGFGCQFTLLLPAVTGARHALLVRCGDTAHALPSQNVHTIIPAGAAEMQAGAKGLELQYAGQKLKLQALSNWLHLSRLNGSAFQAYAKRCSIIVLKGMPEDTALLVDAALHFHELMVQEVGQLVRSLGSLQGAAVLADESPVFLLDLPALARTADQPVHIRTVAVAVSKAPPCILVVDDS